MQKESRLLERLNETSPNKNYTRKSKIQNLRIFRALCTLLQVNDYNFRDPFYNITRPVI